MFFLSPSALISDLPSLTLIFSLSLSPSPLHFWSSLSYSHIFSLSLPPPSFLIFPLLLSYFLSLSPSPLHFWSSLSYSHIFSLSLPPPFISDLPSLTLIFSLSLSLPPSFLIFPLLLSYFLSLTLPPSFLIFPLLLSYFLSLSPSPLHSWSSLSYSHIFSLSLPPPFISDLPSLTLIFSLSLSLPPSFLIFPLLLSYLILSHFFSSLILSLLRALPHGIMAKVLDSSLKVSEFELQSHCYLHFWTNMPGKCIEPPYPPPAMGEIVSLLFFYKDGFDIKPRNQTSPSSLILSCFLHVLCLPPPLSLYSNLIPSLSHL